MAASRIMAATAATQRWLGAAVDDDYAEAALIRARLQPQASAMGPASASEDERAELIRLLNSGPGRRFAYDPQACLLLGILVDWRCEACADPSFWSERAVEAFLLDFVPGRLIAPGVELGRLPEVLGAWVGWATERARLLAFLAGETMGLIKALADQARRACLDGRCWSPVKWAAMQSDVRV